MDSMGMIERGSGSGNWVWKVDGEEETDTCMYVELNIEW